MLSDMDAVSPVPPSPGIPFLPPDLSVANESPMGLHAARFRALAQATGQIYWAADTRGHLIDSASWCAFTGQRPEEASGDGWAAAVHPDEREHVLRDWAAAVAARQPYRDEHRVCRADGQFRRMLVQAYPILAADGTVSEWVGVDMDVTLLHELRAEAQASQEAFQVTFDLAAVGLALVRPDGRILHANQKFSAILGYSRDELLGRPFQEFTYSEDLSHNLILLRQLLAGEISTYTYEKRYVRKDGSLIWVNLTASLKRDQTGAPEYAIAVVEDISARKAAEEAQQQSEKQTQEALKALLRMAELLVQFPVENEEQPALLLGRHVAEMACSLLGCPVAMILTLDPQTLSMEVIGTVGFRPEQETHLHNLISNWIHTPPDLADIQRLMSGETLVLDTTQPPYKDFAALFEIHQAVVAPMQLRSQLIGMVVFNPSKLTHAFTAQQIALAGATAQLVGLVVERERLLREREEARARALALQEANRQMDTFLSLVSHEVRNPLASMKLSLQVIRRRLERPTWDADVPEHHLQPFLTLLRELFEPAERNVGRLERMVNDLLEAARLKQGSLELRLRWIDLCTIVQEAVTEQQALMPERSIQIQRSTEQPLWVNVDADRIRQAIMNYLTNALAYSPATAPIAVGVEQEAGQARVWVRDQGPGIPLAEQERIWERFQRGPGIQGQSAAPGGLGLGLYITSMVIEGHHGQVGLTSTPGQGATFWFTLPLAQAEP